jgi:Putative transposase of IS4/5 family (DUF4096)
MLLKRGVRLGSLCRVDPAHCAGGKARDLGDDGSRRAEGVPAGMVAVSSGPPGRGQALPQSEPWGKQATTTEQYPRGGQERDPDQASEATAAGTPTYAPKAVLLCDEQWELVSPLLPRQKPGQGRPRRDDRQVLRAILWIMDTGSSWRDLPEEEFGPNSTAHGRYRKWCKEGLWSRIVEALGR